MTTLSTNFNVSPYFDDYDEDKNFHRILFRPAVAVQARELTQAQSVLQNQIERFGNHTFKDGSVVDGIGITYFPSVHYVSLENKFTTNTNLFPTDLDSSYLVTNGEDSNTAVRAVIKIANNGIVVAAPDTNRFYFDYIRTGKSGTTDIDRFAEGDTLYIYNSNQSKLETLDGNNLIDTITTLISNDSFTASGNSYCIATTTGIVFQKGFFIKVHPHTIAVNATGTTVDKHVVGFNIVETLINETTDTSLNDNALGYENENAPGAHRLKLTPTLIAKLRDDSANSTNFFAVVEFDNEEPVQQRDDPVYNELSRQLSRRTYEESGDYVVKPFEIEAVANTSNSQNFVYEMSSGIGYVRGHRVELIGTSRVEVPRATTTEYAQNQIFTANYGKYVICDEYVGIPDIENVYNINLYDTAQNSISEYEGNSSAPSGSAIGTADVRAVVYNSGTKGQPSTKYYIYLFNIQMNSGKTFSDVKSLYSTGGAHGNFKTDVVLENGKAILKQSTAGRGVFDAGIFAVKSLTNNTGIGDTFYNYTQVKSGTMIATGGTVSITLDTAGPGTSEEKLTSSPGIYNGSSIDNYNIYLSSNAYTANLTGTMTITSGDVVITGIGTAFDTELVVNNNIRVYSNNSTTHIRRVVSIANATHLTIDAGITATNATANFQQYFVGGTSLDLADINITTNTAFTANTNLTLDSGNQTVYAQYPVMRNQATAIPKLIKKNRFVKIDCSNNINNSTGPWNLGFVDTHKIRNIYVGTTYANTNIERSNWFILDNGQRDDFYDHGQLQIKPEHASKISTSSKLLIELDYFTSNTAASVGFFSVESYPIDDNDTANTSGIQTIEIPRFNGLQLRNAIDFRPYKYNTSTDATIEGTATINPAISNSSYDTPSGGQYHIQADSNFTADYEYYLPRRDLVTLDPEGEFIAQQGKPNETPRLPVVENDQSAIAEVYIPPFPSATKREYDIYSDTVDNFIKTSLITNRRYTMRDIGVLEQRIKRVEYYSVLNTLEQSAANLTVPDSSGLNRFKNGIFVDPFNAHTFGRIDDFEYKIAIDERETVARPAIKRHGIDLNYNSSNSTNVQKTGPVITLPYTNELFIEQRFATKFRNAVESIWQWNGIIDLYPSYDFFRDESYEPNVSVNIDFASPWEQFLSGPFAQMFGDWRRENGDGEWQDIAGTRRVTGASTGWVRWPGLFGRTTVGTVEQQRVTQDIGINVSQQSYNLGEYVKDVSLQPYMRSRLISFVSYNMKPNTTLHAFFDDINVDAHTAPGVLSGITDPEAGDEDRIVDQNGAFGATLTSDDTGFVCGIFRIPEQTFRTGDRVFRLSNVSDLTTGADAQITQAHTIFTGDSLAVTRSSTTINVRQPQIQTTETIDRRSNTFRHFQRLRAPGRDPLAQSFEIVSYTDSSNIELPIGLTGAFVPQVGIYFQSKDNSLGCKVYLCEMTNGFPDQYKIINQAFLPSSSINVSDDASAETVFAFEYPAFLLAQNQYAFMVEPVGNSPEYNIWIAETGDFDVATNEQVYANPYVGTLFVSANRRTWSSFQKEDMKFNIYRANFSPLSGTAVFNNDDDEFLSVDGFNRVNTSLGIEVGDLVYTVNSSANVADTTSLVSNTLSDAVTGRIQYIDESNGEIWLDSSTANGSTSFSNTINPTIVVYRSPDSSNTSYLNANNLIAYSNIATVDNKTYHITVPKFGSIQPAQSDTTVSYKGTTTSDVLETSYTTMDNHQEYEYGNFAKHLMSKSNEITNLSSNKSSTFKIDLSSSSKFISPVINLSEKNALFVENLINNDANNEHTRYGNALTKYISRVIELADGQEAEDLRVYLTAYRPTDSDVKVYAKFWNNEDPEVFDDKIWTELSYNNNGNTVFSSTTNKYDFREYEFFVPSSNSVAQGAFANTNVDTNSTLSGTINISNNSFTINGTSTAFDTELTVGDEIRIVSSDYEAIRTVTNISNSTLITVDNGLQAANTAALYYIFTKPGNDGIVEYKNSSDSRFIGYKKVALKIVLLSSNAVRVPRLQDVRAICLQI